MKSFNINDLADVVHGVIEGTDYRTRMTPSRIEILEPAAVQMGAHAPVGTVEYLLPRGTICVTSMREQYDGLMHGIAEKLQDGFDEGNQTIFLHGVSDPSTPLLDD